MIILHVRFKDSLQELVLSKIMQLPEPIMPIFFTADEGQKNKKNLVLDEKKFSDFRKQNPFGFFLYAEKASFNLSFSDHSEAIVSVDIKDHSLSYLLSNLLSELVNLPIDFGFTCNIDEYKHRNHYFYQMEGQSLETYVGRNYIKYIPGLYWITYISFELLEKHQIGIEQVTAFASMVHKLENGILFKFYDNPDNWRLNCEDLDKICDQEDGIFSLKKLYKLVPNSISLMELLDFLDEWE